MIVNANGSQKGSVSARGSNPAMVVSDVVKIGLVLSLTDSAIESIIDFPALLCEFAYSIKMIVLLTTIPISPVSPITTKRLIGLSV